MLGAVDLGIADDMRRQRVLERVGWRFWRCWASSFTIAPDECMADLFATLDRSDIRPLGKSDGPTVYVEHRTESAPAANDEMPASDYTDRTAPQEFHVDRIGSTPVLQTAGIRTGDRIVVRYLDDNKTATYTLSGERDDPTNGLLSVASPLGKQLLGLVEEDEAEFEVDGRTRRVLVVRTETQAAALH
jgi:transcription elongation GreA/GreB family factor